MEGAHGSEPAREAVERFVLSAHGDLDTVKRLREENPALLNARWEKFDETALEIADPLRGHGAREQI